MKEALSLQQAGACSEQVSYDATGITSRDWDNYQIISFNNIPEFCIDILDRPGSPYLGVGEITTGPTAAAIANAINNAVGLRLRQMPFNSEAIKNSSPSRLENLMLRFKFF